jgi:hypothetical protein
MINARFVQRLPQLSDSGYLAVRVKRLSKEIADWWHKHVQPVVNRDLSRADAGWSWPMFTAFNDWKTLPAMSPHGFAICVERPEGESLPLAPAGLPLALTQLVAPCPFVEDPREYSVLLLYVSAVPRGFFPSLGRIRLVGMAGIDIAIVRALQLGYGGRVMLTVGEKDADRLAAWYRHQCGMVPCRVQAPFAKRCFVHRPETAREAYTRLNHLRG